MNDDNYVIQQEGVSRAVSGTLFSYRLLLLDH